MEQNSGSSGLGHLRSNFRLQDGERPDPARQDWKNHQIHSRRHRGVYQCTSHWRLTRTVRPDDLSRSPSCFCVFGCKSLEAAAPKTIPDCLPPHFQHLHLLSVGHRIYFAPDNLESLSQCPTDDWFFFFWGLQIEPKPTASPEWKSSPVGRFTVCNHYSERFQIYLLSYHDSRLAPAVALNRPAINMLMACGGRDRHQVHLHAAYSAAKSPVAN